MDENSYGVVLLTYKGKALLTYRSNGPIDEEEHPWSFISEATKKKESLKIALTKKVERVMGIKIENIELVSESCYHARLTDYDVNHIKRSENQLLDFFSLKELQKLLLSNSTQKFVSKYGILT